jgi:hypothetical protein
MINSVNCDSDILTLSLNLAQVFSSSDILLVKDRIILISHWNLNLQQYMSEMNDNDKGETSQAVKHITCGCLQLPGFPFKPCQEK